MIYDRKLTSFLVKEIEIPRIVVLTGMRQVGKTTLMRQVFDRISSPSKIFLDLENPINQKIFEEKNYDNILANIRELGFTPGEKSYIFLDEIQVAPQIIQPVKYLYDHFKIKFFLTGSSSFYLKNLFPESLAGRKVVYELFPLDFEEFLVFKGKGRKTIPDFKSRAQDKNILSFEINRSLFEEYLAFGGFPGVVVENDIQRKRQVLEDIFKSYFEKDIKSLADFRELGKLRDLILLLASRVGSKIEISKISSEIGVSRETVYSYLNFLEKSYFISLVYPFSRNMDGEVRGARKVYLCDTGLLNSLGKIPEGKLLENAVFQCLRAAGSLNYYQKYKGPEIDFILNKEIGFEVKQKASQSDWKKLKKIAEALGLKEYYLISKEFSDLEGVILAQDL